MTRGRTLATVSTKGAAGLAGVSKESWGARTKWGKRRRIRGPKRPNSAYIFFCNGHRSQVAADNPHLKHIELQKELAKLWQSADEEKRKPFVAMATDDRRRYDKEMAVYERDEFRACACVPPLSPPPASISLLPFFRKGPLTL